LGYQQGERVPADAPLLGVAVDLKTDRMAAPQRPWRLRQPKEHQQKIRAAGPSYYNARPPNSSKAKDTIDNTKNDDDL